MRHFIPKGDDINKTTLFRIQDMCAVKVCLILKRLIIRHLRNWIQIDK